MVDTVSTSMSENRQLRLMAIIFGALIALLALAYFLFLRFNYAVLYKDLSVTDASIIVSELEAREIKYRLKNGGKDILVPAVEADAVRLGILDAEAPTKNLDGFSLFDESEMGLTDFAQKIKYQRALQGELARTIMMIDGVENARVHIAMPERALFRGQTGRPTAAVTLVTRSGQFDEETRISGIQRLVAAAVPDLNLEDVTVLNSVGEIISKVETPVSAVLDEYVKIAAAYKQEIDIAMAVEKPQLDYDLKVSARPMRINTDGEAKDGVAKRNYALRIALTTDEVLSEAEQASVTTLIEETLQIDKAQGDLIAFKQRDLPLNLSLASTAAAADIKASMPAQTIVPNAGVVLPNVPTPILIAGGAGLVLLLGGSFAAMRRRKPMLSTEEHIEFAKRLRLQLQEDAI